MKKVLAFFLSLSILFSMAACLGREQAETDVPVKTDVPDKTEAPDKAASPADAGAATQKEDTATDTGSKTLVVYCPHPVEFINPIIAEYEAETGVTVEVITAGTGELLKRVEAEQENPLGDILWGGSPTTFGPKQALFENYRSSNEDDIMDDYKNSEGAFTRFTVMPSVIMVNKNLAGDISVKGYEDVLNPAFIGKIAFADPSKSSSSWEHLVNMLHAMGDGDPEKGWDYVDKLCENLDGKLLGGSSASTGLWYF